MADKIIQRHDTKANWESENPILAEGEIGFVTNTDMYKIGDGESTWNNLPMRGFNGNIVAEKGTNNSSVMSQKAVTEELNELQTSIDEEINRATTKENAIETDLQEEITRAKETEQQLNNKINSNSSSISGFESSVKAFDTALKYEVGRATNKENSLQTAIDAEKTRAEQAEQTLTTNLNKEVTERQTAITNVTNSLNAEITNRENKDTTLKNTMVKSMISDDEKFNSVFKELYIDKFLRISNISKVAITKNTENGKLQLILYRRVDNYAYWLTFNTDETNSLVFTVTSDGDVNDETVEDADKIFGVSSVTFYAVIDTSKIPTLNFVADITTIRWSNIQSIRYSPTINHYIDSYRYANGITANSIFREIYFENLTVTSKSNDYTQEVVAKAIRKTIQFQGIHYNKTTSTYSVNITFNETFYGRGEGIGIYVGIGTKGKNIHKSNAITAETENFIFKADAMYSVVDWNYITNLENETELGAYINLAAYAKDGVININNSPIIYSAIGNKIGWSASFNMNDYKTQGVYYVSGERTATADNLPILNTGYISGQITVLDANGCVTQYLKLTNAGGSEGKEYIRTFANGSWSMWRELQSTTVFNDGIDDASLKNYEDNGYYTGAILNTIGSATGSDMSDLYNVTEDFKRYVKSSSGYAHLPSGTFFTMKVMNNYAVVKASQSWSASAFHTITQKADIQLWDGTFLCVQRSRIADRGWTNWFIVNL